MNTINSSFWLSLYFFLLILLFYVIYKKKWYLLTHESLFKQKIFLLSILVPFSAFIYFGIFAWWGHNLQLDSRGYENFYNISKFPLLLLAMSVPMAAIVNNIHRTIQTEKQIFETQKKNLTDSYYAHLKSMTDSFKDLPEHDITITHQGKKITKKLKINYPKQLYNVLFPNSTPLNGASYEMDRRFTSIILSYHKELIKHCELLNNLFDNESKSLTDEERQTEREKGIIYHWSEIEKIIDTLYSYTAISNSDFGITIQFISGGNFVITNMLNLDDLYKTASAIHDINMSILDRVEEFTFIEGMVLQKTPSSLSSLLNNTNLKAFINRKTNTFTIDYTTEHFCKLVEQNGDTLAAEMINGYEKALTNTNHITDK